MVGKQSLREEDYGGMNPAFVSLFLSIPMKIVTQKSAGCGLQKEHRVPTFVGMVYTARLSRCKTGSRGLVIHKP